MSFRKVPLTIGAVAALTTFATGCKVTAPQNTALVRFVHAVSNGGPLDFYANGTRDVNGLEFQNATAYFVVDSGSAIPFAIAIINDTTPVLTTTETVQGAHTYTFLAVDSMAGLTPLFVSDSNTAPDKNDVKLRLIHAAPSFKSVDLYIVKQGAALGTSPNFSSFNFEQVSTYQLVSPGSYFIVATAPGNVGTIAAVDTLSGLGTGSVRTIILMDSKNGHLPLKMVTVNDVTR
jgi:Domain of unknown function (DUF4397)